MALDWRVVRIERWPTEHTRERVSHRFRKTVRRHNEWRGSYTDTVNDVDWGATVALLERELEHLDARNVVLQMAVTRRELRKDGWIRADARPEHPGVILSFDSRFGPLSYPCDTYTEWQANVRAIAVSLEWLRGVDRHGVTKRGEQYAGFARLPPAGGTTENRPEIIQRGRELIAKHGSARNALFATHPDRGGDPDDFLAVTAARRA
jgi:hypothetical protein